MSQFPMQEVPIVYHPPKEFWMRLRMAWSVLMNRPWHTMVCIYSQPKVQEGGLKQ